MMESFTGFADNLANQVAIAFQGVLVLFFVVSPFVGKLIHRGIASASTQVMIACTMLLLGNLSYMGMIYLIYPILPDDTISDFAWIILSFCLAVSLSILLGRYMNWIMSDNFKAAIWTQEYEDLTDDDLMPFDRHRKREMERRKRSRHE